MWCSRLVENDFLRFSISFNHKRLQYFYFGPWCPELFSKKVFGPVHFPCFLQLFHRMVLKSRYRVERMRTEMVMFVQTSNNSNFYIHSIMYLNLLSRKTFGFCLKSSTMSVMWKFSLLFYFIQWGIFCYHKPSCQSPESSSYSGCCLSTLLFRVIFRVIFIRNKGQIQNSNVERTETFCRIQKKIRSFRS